MRIGLLFGPDSVDYPLTWRAMQAGIQTRYIREPLHDESGTSIWRFREEDLDWPCMLYASYGVIEHVPNRGSQYLSVGDYHTYIRNLQWEFDHSGQVLLKFDRKQKNNKMHPLNECEINADSHGLNIISQGNDPRLLLPSFSSKNVHSAVMKLAVETPSDTEIQLYYMTPDTEVYNENHSLKQKTKKGLNVLYFFLPIDEVTGPLRFDPGTDQGTYRLSELEIQQLAQETEQ